MLLDKNYNGGEIKSGFIQQFVTPGGFFTFQQDNTPSHRAREVAAQFLWCDDMLSC